MLSEFLGLFVIYFVIIDPFFTLGAFNSLSKGMKERQKASVALQACMIAFAMVVLFSLFGTSILDALYVQIDDLKVAGGIIFLLLGLHMVLGFDTSPKIEKGESGAIATVIATPLISGPAVIMMSIISAEEYGALLVLAASATVILIVYAFLYHSKLIMRLMGKNALSILSTFIGIVTLSWGISYIREGLGF